MSENMYTNPEEAVVALKNENEKLEIAKEWELIEFQLRDPKMWSIWNTKDSTSLASFINT